MPHQAHNIRWSALTENLKFQKADLYKNGGIPCDLVWRFKSDQGKKIAHFAESFVRTLEEHTDCERKKYPTYEEPNRDDVLIDERLARKIARAIFEFRTGHDNRRGVTWKSLCPHKDDTQEVLGEDDPRRRRGEDGMVYACSCPLPFKERKTAAFLRGYKSYEYNLWEHANGAAFNNNQTILALLAYGEMGPILRACAHPDAHFKTWQHMSGYFEDGLGWAVLYQHALDAYIGLNMVDSMPELWDPSTGCRRQDPNAQYLEIEDEYRNTVFYQRMLEDCTEFKYQYIVTHLHSQFFGDRRDYLGTFDKNLAHKWPAFTKLREGHRRFPKGEVDLGWTGRHRFPQGVIPFGIFLNHGRGERWHKSSAEDIAQTAEMLYSRGLPIELVLDILDRAGLRTPRRRLPVANDPMHPANRKELNKYVLFGWLTLIRCNMLAREAGTKIDWKSEIFSRLYRWVGVPSGWKCKLLDADSDGYYPSLDDGNTWRFLDRTGQVTNEVDTRPYD